MKFTRQGTGSKTLTLQQLRSSMSKVATQPQAKSSFSMNNLGRRPGMKFNKPSVHVDCGCSGGKRINI